MRTALTLAFIVLVSPVIAQADTVRLSVPIPLDDYTIDHAGPTQRVLMDSYGLLHDAGAPQLPMRIFAIAIPPGAKVVDVSFSASGPLPVPGTFALAPAPVWEPISTATPAARAAEQRDFDAREAAIYGQDSAFPAAPVEFVRTAGYRSYNLVDVRVCPLAYQPQSQRLLRYTDLTVHVDYRPAPRCATLVADRAPALQRAARELILNDDQARAWLAAPPTRSTGNYDFVVITPQALQSAVTPLVTWEQQKGRSPFVATTEWISSSYAGADLPEQIRNFLRHYYPADRWGIEHVLLVGDQTDIPMRLVSQDLGYGAPWTDMYYAELSLPDHASWDSDSDGRYAEDTDDFDYYCEVGIGRIPWSDPAIVQLICEKSVAFEQNHDPTYKRNILLPASFFWPDTDCAVFAETLLAAPHLATWSSFRLYEVAYSAYSPDLDITRANVVTEWSSQPYAVVSWCGHGSPNSAHRYYPNMPAFIASGDCPMLGNDAPSIIFADSCITADPTSVSLGRSMLYRGAIGYVGATQVAGGRRGWQTIEDGSSQTLNYWFNYHVTSGRYTQGEALRQALHTTYQQGLWRWPKYEAPEWTLYGNPDLRLDAVPAVSIRFPDGLPETITPHIPTGIAVEIEPLLDTLVPGSPTLHYRFKDGPFTAVPLTPRGGIAYEATLPPVGCGALPEFYVSAAGVGCGQITEPDNAPIHTHSAPVGSQAIMFCDDFEQSTGWMVENLGASDGLWERGVPVNDPGWPYDPAADADASGQCALTANRLGNSDVDGGGVRLTSPVLDLSAPNITVQYSYYIYQDDQSASDYLLVEASSNGLSGPWHELTHYLYNNGLSWRAEVFSGSELETLGLTMSNNAHLRFTAYDNGTDHAVEAGLDAFAVLSFACTAPLPGDLNCDGLVDFDDVNPFVTAMILGPDSYAGHYPGCHYLHADLTGDGIVGFEDINPFVVLLTTP